MKKIGIIGVYPPPYGGISVHIERLTAVLEQENIPYVVYDETKETIHKGEHIIPVQGIESWCRSYLFKKDDVDVIHNHFLRWQVRFLLSLLRLKGKKIVHTIHSMRDTRYTIAHKIMIFLTGLLSNHFVVVNDEIKENLIELKIPAKKISVIPAFIPPVEDGNVATIPTYVEEFLHNHKRVIVANGGVGNYYQSKELYGVDLCVEMFKKMSEEDQDVGFIYCITHIVDENARVKLEKRIEEFGLSDRFLFVYEKMPFYPLLKRANLFVRPTRSDGDAISIREALYYGVPVVTSDVVQRPNGVSLFRNDDADDFFLICSKQLNSTREKHNNYAAEQNIFISELLDILKS